MEEQADAYKQRTLEAESERDAMAQQLSAAREENSALVSQW
jgi:hypothetical protein